MALDEDSGFDDIAFSLTNRKGEQVSEFRCNLPRSKLEVLDMLAISESKSRGEFVSRREIGERIISDFIQKEIDKAMLIQQVFEKNPKALDK